MTTTDTRTPTESGYQRFSLARLVRRISRLEWSVAALISVVFAGLIIAEPEILEAPFENGRFTLFTVGGTGVAALALAVMLRLRVPPAVRLMVLGSGEFVGLAGHSGTGDAGFFADDSGSLVLRLENLDIQNGPDLRLYLVPGADRTAPDDGSLYLGELRGKVGNQTYELPGEFSLTDGDWTVLVWCEAFQVEFVGATVSVS